MRGILAFNSSVAGDPGFRVYVAAIMGIAVIVGVNIWLGSGAIPYDLFELP